MIGHFIWCVSLPCINVRFRHLGHDKHVFLTFACLILAKSLLTGSWVQLFITCSIGFLHHYIDISSHWRLWDHIKGSVHIFLLCLELIFFLCIVYVDFVMASGLPWRGLLIVELVQNWCLVVALKVARGLDWSTFTVFFILLQESPSSFVSLMTNRSLTCLL